MKYRFHFILFIYIKQTKTPQVQVKLFGISVLMHVSDQVLIDHWISLWLCRHLLVSSCFCVTSFHPPKLGKVVMKKAGVADKSWRLPVKLALLFTSKPVEGRGGRGCTEITIGCQKYFFMHSQHILATGEMAKDIYINKSWKMWKKKWVYTPF